MLPVYATLAEVPETLKEHYKLFNGKYVPDISEDHPTNIANRTLTTDKAAADAQVVNLRADLTSAKADAEAAKHASAIPRGHRAVPTADAELLDKLKPHGTGDELVAKLTEHKTLKDESSERVRQDNLRAVAKELGYDNVEAFVRLPGLPEFEIRDANGKKTVIAKVKGDGDVVTERPAQEFIESSTEIAPFLSALKSEGGTYVPEQRRDTGDKSSDVYSRLRDATKASQEASPGIGAVKERFGFAKVA